MKTLIILSLLIIAFTSCKKDRVCKCTYQDGSTVSQMTLTNVTKKEAKSQCVSSSQAITCSVN